MDVSVEDVEDDDDEEEEGGGEQCACVCAKKGRGLSIFGGEP